MPDVGRVRNDGWESSREAARYEIINLNPAEIVPGQAQFSAIYKCGFVKFKPVKLARVSHRTCRGKKCSWSNSGIKQRVWLFLGHPRSHNLGQPGRRPELPFLSQFLTLRPSTRKRLKPGLNWMESFHLSSPLSDSPKNLQSWLGQLKPPSVKGHIRQNVSIPIFPPANLRVSWGNRRGWIGRRKLRRLP